jgi:hypothetical protein
MRRTAWQVVHFMIDALSVNTGMIKAGATVTAVVK